jgi:hypothetical protein
MKVCRICNGTKQAVLNVGVSVTMTCECWACKRKKVTCEHL